MAIRSMEAGAYESDDDDLDAPSQKLPIAIRKSLAAQRTRAWRAHERDRGVDNFISEVAELASSQSVTDEDDLDLERPVKRRKIISDTVRSEDGSTNEGELAYKRFKARKSDARKQKSKSGRIARTMEADRQAQSHGNSKAVKQGANANGKKQNAKDYGDKPSDEEALDNITPDYVRNRRTKFDKRAEKLKEAGLNLPPSYDDIEFSDDEHLEDMKERPDFPHLRPCAPYKDIQLPFSGGVIPAPIAQWLREYQVKGTEFLHELFVYQKGGILGDDMGLGKTVQVIAFLTTAYGKTGDERDEKRMRKLRRRGASWYPRTLIICPGSLMANWQEELDRWGWWHADVYHGSASTKEAVLSAAQSGMLEIVITTYTTYRQNREAINMVQWDCVVADECHQVKESKSEISKAMNEVNALCRIGLTGTAIQNKYEELWTLLNWTNPGRFGSMATWKVSICDPLKLGQSHEATLYQLARARKTAKSLVENLLPQFFLRRMKTLIKDQLPKKSDRVVFCPLTETQAMAYENFLDSEIVRTIKYSGDDCDCGSGKKAGWCCFMTLEDESKWQNWVFPAIANLQKLSNHLAILIPQGSDPPEKQAKDLEMLQIAVPDQWRHLYANRDKLENFKNLEFCGKWKVLRKLLKFWHDEEGAKNKVLVFSHSVRLLKMLQSLFNHTSYNVTYLDGAMSYDARYAAVADFNTDPSQFVFLISTKAGGVGLNITSANKVVVVDPNWNPSYDLQAQDRAYRIGQTRDVEVFRLVSQGTLEEIVYARQIYKQQQASIGYNASSERRYFTGVQGKVEQKGEIFGLRNLFSYGKDDVVLRDIVNKTNVAESRADVRVASPNLDDGNEDEKGVDEDSKVKVEDEGEDAAMSQLVAEITGDDRQGKMRRKKASPERSAEGPKRPDPVTAILASVGVQYTHENSEVIGSSKVEARLSKRAEDAAEGEKWGTQEQQAKVFFEESQKDAQFNELAGVNVHGGVRYKFRPPADVKRRQFCSMAKWAGYEDPVEFALVIEGWTQGERRDYLTRFYRWRTDLLTEAVKGLDEEANGLEEIKEEVKTDDYSDDGEEVKEKGGTAIEMASESDGEGDDDDDEL